MRRKKRIRWGRLCGLIFFVVLTITVISGIGQNLKLWADEIIKNRNSSAEDNFIEVFGMKAEKATEESETAELVVENEVIAAFAAGNGLSVNAWPAELVELLERNPDAKDFVLNYPLKKNQVFNINLSEYVNSVTVPLFHQWDERWGYTSYGSNVMGLTGCGPTCLSMVCIYLLQDAVYTPRYVADFAEKNGYYVEGSGSAWTLISEGGEALGLDVVEISLDEKRMIKNLELGSPIICIMGPGDFTTTGHFIVLRGVVDGKFVVNDPNSKSNSERLWSYDEICGQIKNLWVCRLPQ